MNKFFSWMKQSNLALLLALILATGLLVSGCGGGSDSYDKPVILSNPAIEGHATNTLITPEVLKDWMDAGYVNADNSFDGKVVILDYASPDAALRIPGACKVTTGALAATRLEGIAETGTLVPTGAMIDDVVQRLGIDENTTIVFTTGGGIFYQARAYFIFRYWGFPIERLKVLDGGNAAWNEAVNENGWGTDYALTQDVPTPTPSDYSVRNLGKLNDHLRMSISEMITEVYPALQNGTMFHLDALGPAHAAGDTQTSDLINSQTEVVVFDGRIRGSAPLAQGTLYTNNRFKSKDEVLGLFEAAGWTGLPTSVACRAGVSCNTLYLALEAILGAPVYTYDGSWGQWGLYSNNKEKGGLIPENLTGERARWSTDQYSISGPLDSPTEVPVYNQDRLAEGKEIADLLIDTSVLYGTNGPTDPRANQVENEDREYIETPPSASGPANSTSGSAGGGC